MSGSTIHMRDQSVHPLRRARALVVAISVALSGASLGVSGAAAADPTTHGPGSPAWTHHLELEYGDRMPAGPMANGPGSPAWAHHLELEYGDRTPADPATHGPGSPAWTRHLELEYGH